MKTFFLLFAFALSAMAAGGQEKFTVHSDIVALSVNGKAFTVHEQNHVPNWNSAPPDSDARIVELKNLMITGTLAAGTVLESIEMTTAAEGAAATFSTDRPCCQPFDFNGATVQPGEQVYYVKVAVPDGTSYQVYTLSIMGLNRANHTQYSKYGEPTFVADSYHTWIWALQNTQPGQIIAVTRIDQSLYKTGEYPFKPHIEDKQDLVIRSLSGNPEDLILRGHGFHKGAYRGGLPHDELFVVSGAKTSNIIVYGITVRESTANGLKLNGYGEENIIFDNCRMIDVNERAFKGSGPQIGGAYTRSRNISILNCRFENTQIPVESDHDANFNGDYIGGIDVMNISGLTIADNTFQNIKGKNGDARGAIFIWGQDGCTDVLIENNIILNCDKGIALGNNSGNPADNSAGGFYINGAVIRNNFIYDPHWDLIEMNRVNDVKIHNNTFWKANAARRGIRDSGGTANPSHNISIINNIIRGAANEHPRGNNIDLRQNLFHINEPSGVVPGEGNIIFNISEDFFMNAAEGNFRLRESSTRAFRNGIPLSEVETDFFGTRRGLTPDLGAHQYTEPEFSYVEEK